MDFTYFGAVIIAATVVVLVKRGGTISRTVALRTVAFAIILNGALLINWPHALDWGWAFLALDLMMLVAMTLIGCLLAAPSLLFAVFGKPSQ